jgi:hypothetical protein
VQDPAPTRLERAGEIAAAVGSLRPAEPNLRRALHASIAIVIGLTIGLAIFTTLGKLPEVDWRFRPWAVILGMLGLSAFLLANAEIWRHLLAALGPELEARPSRAIWFTSALGRYVPASVLLPMLRVALSEREGVPKRICLASVVYDVALFFAAALILSSYFVLELPELADQPGRYLVLALPIVAVVALQPRFFHTFADRALERLGRAQLPLSLPSVRVAEFIALYALTFVFAGLGVYALAQLVYPVGISELFTVAGAFAVGTALSIIAFVLPGGLVAREAGIALALAPVMPAGPALALAVLVRIVQMGLELLFAAVTPPLARRASDSDAARAAARGQGD